MLEYLLLCFFILLILLLMVVCFWREIFGKKLFLVVLYLYLVVLVFVIVVCICGWVMMVIFISLLIDFGGMFVGLVGFKDKGFLLIMCLYLVIVFRRDLWILVMIICVVVMCFFVCDRFVVLVLLFLKCCWILE